MEYKEGVRKALKELENELVESDNLSATAQNIRLSKDVDRVKELLRRLKELQSSLAQYIDRLSAVKGGDFDENEMGMIIEKIREAEATAEGMKALDEALSAQIEAVNHWNADKERLRNETEPVIEAIHTLVDEYANRQPFEKANEDERVAEGLLARLSTAQEEVEEVCERLKSAVPECTEAVDETTSLNEKILDEVARTQVND